MPAPTTAPLLDLDSDLGAALDSGRVAAARDAVVVRLAEIPRGPWKPGANPFAVRPGFGLLVLEGFIVRRATLEGRTALDLIGPGDVTRPWQLGDPDAPYVVVTEVRALSDVRLAVLDGRACAEIAPYPEILDALAWRLMLRGRRVVAQLVLAQLSAVESRLLIALWGLAYQWGRVCRDGTIVDVPLTHELLGNLVGARRPSVTHALTALAERGAIARHGSRGWLLIGDPPTDVAGRRPSPWDAGAAAA